MWVNSWVIEGFLCGKNTTMKNKDTGSPLSQTDKFSMRDVGKIFKEKCFNIL